MELLVLGAAALVIAYLFSFPRWRRRDIERARKRRPCRVPDGGLVAPLDEVFYPLAYEAKLLWDAQSQLPAPAPDADGNRPDLTSGRIRITIPTPSTAP